MARIAFLTCHLTGTGHFVRTLALARAAAAAGHLPTVISGGRPLDHLDTDGIDLVQLPPIVVQGFEFTVLRRPDGALADEAYMVRRAKILTDVLRDRRPQALVTELFPFGRRALAGEFLHAIDAVRAVDPRCAIISSIRDVPEPKPRRLDEVSSRVSQLFDAVIVHGDSGVIPLEASWPLSDPARPKVRYAGYVGASRSVDEMPRGETVLVSVGGGVLGRELLRAAVGSPAFSTRPWHVLVGGADAAELAADLRQGISHQRIKIEPARPDYHRLLAQAACSISLCGYNTALDIARETVPALLVPSEEAGEQEQRIRAEYWARHDGIDLMRMGDVTPEGLAAAMDRLASNGPRAPVPVQIDDGARAIGLIDNTIKAKCKP